MYSYLTILDIPIDPTISSNNWYGRSIEIKLHIKKQSMDHNYHKQIQSGLQIWRYSCVYIYIYHNIDRWCKRLRDDSTWEAKRGTRSPWLLDAFPIECGRKQWGGDTWGRRRRRRWVVWMDPPPAYIKSGCLKILNVFVLSRVIVLPEGLKNCFGGGWKFFYVRRPLLQSTLYLWRGFFFLFSTVIWFFIKFILF